MADEPANPSLVDLTIEQGLSNYRPSSNSRTSSTSQYHFQSTGPGFKLKSRFIVVKKSQESVNPQNPAR